MKINLSFVKSSFSEHDGTASIAKVLICMLVCFVLGAGISLCILAYNKKITMIEFDNFLSTAGTFIATSCGPLYAVNAGADYLNKKSLNENPRL